MSTISTDTHGATLGIEGPARARVLEPFGIWAAASIPELVEHIVEHHHDVLFPRALASETTS